MLEVEANLNILRNCEKEILDMTFKWFTSLPTFIAEQIHYVLDANDLTKLKMFKTRVQDKITEAESLSLKNFAETSPKDHENYRRINEQLSFLSETVKSLKNVMSPDKHASKVSDTGNDDMCQSLFSSDSDDETSVSKKFKKPLDSVRKPVFEKKNVSSTLLTVKPATLDAEFEKLPSTQEIEQVFDKWKDSKDKKLETKRAEKRKRSSTGKSNSRTSTKSSSKAEESKSLFDNFDDDSAFANISDSQLFGSFNEKRRSTDIETDDSCSIVEQTRLNSSKKPTTKLPSANISEYEKNTVKPFEPKISSRFLEAMSAPKKAFDPKIPGRVLNSIANTNDTSLGDVSRIPDTFADLQDKSRASWDASANEKTLKKSTESFKLGDTVANAFDNTFEPSVSHISDTFSKGFQPKSASNLLSTRKASNESPSTSTNSSFNLEPDLLKSIDRVVDTICSVNVVPGTAPSNSKFKPKAPTFGNGNFTVNNSSIVPQTEPQRKDSDKNANQINFSSSINNTERFDDMVSSPAIPSNDDLFDEIFESQFIREIDRIDEVLLKNSAANKENIQKNIPAYQDNNSESFFWNNFPEFTVFIISRFIFQA